MWFVPWEVEFEGSQTTTNVLVDATSNSVVPAVGGQVPSKRRYVPDEVDKAFYKKVSLPPAMPCNLESSRVDLELAR